MLSPYKQLFIIAFSWKMTITEHLIYVIFQDSRNTFCRPPGTFYEPEAWKSACSFHKEQDKCKTGYHCVTANVFTDSCPAQK